MCVCVCVCVHAVAQVVAFQPAPHQIIHALFSQGLLKNCVASLRALYQQLNGPGGQRMQGSHRCGLACTHGHTSTHTRAHT